MGKTQSSLRRAVIAPTWIASWPRNWPQRPSSPCRCRFSASWSARRISTMFRYSSRSAAASSPRRLLPSAVSSPAGENRARTGSSAATTRTTSAIAGNILYRSYIGDPYGGEHEHQEAEHLPGLPPSQEDRRRLPAARRLPPRGGAADVGGLHRHLRLPAPADVWHPLSPPARQERRDQQRAPHPSLRLGDRDPVDRRVPGHHHLVGTPAPMAGDHLWHRRRARH